MGFFTTAPILYARRHRTTIVAALLLVLVRSLHTRVHIWRKILTTMNYNHDNNTALIHLVGSVMCISVIIEHFVTLPRTRRLLLFSDSPKPQFQG